MESTEIVWPEMVKGHSYEVTFFHPNHERELQLIGAYDSFSKNAYTFKPSGIIRYTSHPAETRYYYDKVTIPLAYITKIVDSNDFGMFSSNMIGNKIGGKTRRRRQQNRKSKRRRYKRKTGRL